MSTTLRIVVAIIAVIVACGLPAQAQDSRAPDTAGSQVLKASDALQAGNITSALATCRQLRTQTLPVRDRAETLRVCSIANYLGNQPRRARRLWVKYMRLAAKLGDAPYLDPALVPPRAIVFFEQVRNDNADIVAVRTRVRKRAWLNLIPAAGQFQNGDRGKGWFVVGAGSVLLGTAIASAALLRSWCSPRTSVCETADGRSRARAARVLRTTNWLANGLVVGLFAYSIADAWLGYRAAGNHATDGSSSLRVMATMTATGGGAAASWQF